MSNTDEQLPSIDSDTLEDVTGGVSGATKTDSNTQVTAALQAISSSLASLKSGGNNSNNAFSQLLPMMMLFGGKGGGGGGACPCGCGMANCMRR
jgi:hypothetical protein